MELFAPRHESLLFYRFAHFFGEVHVVVQVVNRVQHRAENFTRFVEVMQVGAAEVFAGVARATLIERAMIVTHLRVLQLDVAEAGEEPTVTRVTRGHHTVEHVDAALHGVHQIFRRTDTHQVVRLVRRQARPDKVEDAMHVLFRFTNREAADGNTVKADVVQARERFRAQRLEQRALYDAEERVSVLQAKVFVF